MQTRNPRAVIAITGAALFMIVLDNLIVLSTLPAMQRSLHASLAELEWIVNAYILSFAVLILTGAALGERFGRRRVFTLGLLLFVAASAAGGWAPNVGVLIVARVVQGAGAAVLMPLTLTLLSAAFPVERRAAALGMWSAISGLGVALGPIVGGLLTSGLSWHWIFWINVPVGLVAAALSSRVLAESRGRVEPVDRVGLLLASVGIFAMVWTTVRANGVGWAAPVTLVGYAIGAAMIAAFVRWEGRRPQPMLPLRLFANRVFSTSNAAGFLLHFAMFGAFFLIIQFLARVRGIGPVMAGVWTLPWTVMPLVVSPFAARLGRRVAPALLTAIGLGLIGLGVLAIAAILTPVTQPAAMAIPLLSIGGGIGLVLPNIAGLTMAAVPAEDIGKASGTLSTARQLGSVFGVAVGVAIFELNGSYATGSAASAGTSDALFAAALAAFAGAVLALTIVPRPAILRQAATT